MQGSSYRKPGARMLVTRHGWKAGSISGGCLEADLVRQAHWLVAEGRATLRRYDTSAEGAAALGCGGEIEVLVEPFGQDTPLRDAMTRATRLRETVEVFTVVEQGDPQLGRRLLQTARSHVEPTAANRRRMRVGGVELEVLHEIFRPSPRLLVFGAGHDALPLVSFAQALGWDVHVVDWRPHLLTPARFPSAERHLLGGDALDAAPLEEGCAVVLMSHQLGYDGAALRQALGSPLPRYVGVLGPRHRTDDLLAQLPPGTSLSRVRAPVGLDLGGEGPAAVALAIVSELQVVWSGRSARPLGTEAPKPQPVERERVG